MDHSPPGSSVHGILQARILEWVAMPSSRGPSRPRDLTHVSYVFSTGRQVLYQPLVSLGKPPAPLGHFKNKREIELMYSGCSLLAVYPSHQRCTSRKAPGSVWIPRLSPQLPEAT